MAIQDPTKKKKQIEQGGSGGSEGTAAANLSGMPKFQDAGITGVPNPLKPLARIGEAIGGAVYEGRQALANASATSAQGGMISPITNAKIPTYSLPTFSKPATVSNRVDPIVEQINAPVPAVAASTAPTPTFSKPVETATPIAQQTQAVLGGPLLDQLNQVQPAKFSNVLPTKTEVYRDAANPNQANINIGGVSRNTISGEKPLSDTQINNMNKAIQYYESPEAKAKSQAAFDKFQAELSGKKLEAEKAKLGAFIAEQRRNPTVDIRITDKAVDQLADLNRDATERYKAQLGAGEDLAANKIASSGLSLNVAKEEANQEQTKLGNYQAAQKEVIAMKEKSATPREMFSTFRNMTGQPLNLDQMRVIADSDSMNEALKDTNSFANFLNQYQLPQEDFINVMGEYKKRYSTQ